MNYGQWGQLFSLAPPAAGNQLTRSIPGDTFIALEIIRFTLTTSAAVGNRFPVVDVLDGDNNVIFRAASSTALAASLVRGITAIVGGALGAASAAGEEMLPLPPTLLPPGFKVRLGAIGILAADQVSAASIYARSAGTGLLAPSPGATPYIADMTQG